MQSEKNSSDAVQKHNVGRDWQSWQLVVGHAGDSSVLIQCPMFLRTLGATGSGRSIALIGLAEQMLARGGSVLWVDSRVHPRVATVLRRQAAHYRVEYADTASFARGDQTVIASLMTLGGIGHCVPLRQPTLDQGEDEQTRVRVAEILRFLSDCQLRGARPTLIIFNQVVSAFEGRALGLGGLPAKLRSAGHSVVFSDKAIKADALDVSAQARQYLLHRMHHAHARRLVSALLPVCRQKTSVPIAAFAARSAEEESETLVNQVSLLADNYAVYCSDGGWVLLKSSAPTLRGRSSGTGLQANLRQ